MHFKHVQTATQNQGILSDNSISHLSGMVLLMMKDLDNETILEIHILRRFLTRKHLSMQLHLDSCFWRLNPMFLLFESKFASFKMVSTSDVSWSINHILVRIYIHIHIHIIYCTIYIYGGFLKCGYPNSWMVFISQSSNGLGHHTANPCPPLAPTCPRLPPWRCGWMGF